MEAKVAVLVLVFGVLLGSLVTSIVMAAEEAETIKVTTNTERCFGYGQAIKKLAYFESGHCWVKEYPRDGYINIIKLY